MLHFVIETTKYNNSFLKINYSGEKISSAKNDTSTLHSTDNIEPAAPNYEPLGIKQDRISNLRIAIDFDHIEFNDPDLKKITKH
jgi:hypothetical protein